MSVIAIVHTKGGVGKTTSGIYLATAASRAGITVTVLDADPQGSATDWSEAAAESGAKLPFPVRPASARALHADPESQLTIIDTPPGTAGAIDASIEAADLVIVPTGVSPLDVRRVWPTLEVTAHRPTAVLLTAVDLRTTLATEVHELLEAEDVPVIHTPILRREAMRKSYGSTPDHLHGYDDVLTEILEAIS